MLSAAAMVWSDFSFSSACSGLGRGVLNIVVFPFVLLHAP